MPVPNCFFQVAFVASSDSIIQIQTVQSFAILWQSPWAILGTVYLISPSLCLAKFYLLYLKHFGITCLLLVAVFIFFFHMLICVVILWISVNISARWKHSVCQFTSESSCVPFSLCSQAAPHSFGQIYAALLPGGKFSYVFCLLLIFTSLCLKPPKFKKYLSPNPSVFFHCSSDFSVSILLSFQYLQIGRRKYFFIYAHIFYICIWFVRRNKGCLAY